MTIKTQLSCFGFVCGCFLLLSGRSILTQGFAPVPSSRFHSVSTLNLLKDEETATREREEMLQQQTFGGYTVKQRLREEVESPFRQVRFFGFASTAGSAMVALYFSALSVVKANIMNDPDSLQNAIEGSAINLAGVVVCSVLAAREWRIGEANLQRIAKGGAIARLQVMAPAITTTSEEEEQKLKQKRRTLSEYRRNARVLIAAGGPEYIATLARSLTSDQFEDTNDIPEKLQDVDVVVVPVLLDSKRQVSFDTQEFWKSVEAQEGDRNFDISRATNAVAFPVGAGAWTDCLASEIETAQKQKFDWLQKGLTITLKKNGKVLRRATGQPQWGYLIGAMETLDGSKFGMPGDSEKYGGP